MRRQQKTYGFMRDFSGGGMRIDNIFGDFAGDLSEGESYAIRLPRHFFEEDIYIRCKLIYRRPAFCGFQFDEPGIAGGIPQ